MLFVCSLLLCSFYFQATNGLTLPFVPADEDVWKAEGLDGLPSGSLLSSNPAGGAANNAGWTVDASSAQGGSPGSNVIDNNDNTYWHSQYSPTMINLPHTITIDTKQNRNVEGITYVPRQDGQKNGNIGQHKIYLSKDGVNFGAPVAYGTWYDDQTTKSAAFEPTEARYVRIVAITEAGNRGPFTAAASFSVFVGGTVQTQTGVGAWGPTINFPLVPAAAAVSPDSGNVVMWSASFYNKFEQTANNQQGFTLSAVYNPTTKIVTPRTVTNTGHDMFCPGISIDASGRVVITGGDTSEKMSVYASGNDNWAGGPNMKIKRGYQSQVTMGDGRIFVIGGSWNGGEGNKNGEVWVPGTNSWNTLPDSTVNKMLTADIKGIYRSDNHAMLFNWKNGYAFQAGPSKQMNWYNTRGNGGVVGAGNRGNDDHAMCGIAVMYDASKGKILVTGGSKDYNGAAATANAHLITLGDPNQAVNAQTINTMWYKRIFASAVVLPDGKVFITGGQTVGDAFHDTNPILTSELWHPSTTNFYKTAPNSTPRVYHSWSLLLQDATVMVGGSGLCGGCNENHFDAQIFTPPYLLDRNTNAKLPRPVINSISSRNNVPGAKITVRTDSAVTAFSLVRYGSSTHTVNTDQRRVPLTFETAGTNQYTVTLGPADYGIMTPGHWMLFAMNNAGVPSVAAVVYIW